MVEESSNIGATPAAVRTDPRLPFIGYQGPHGFMIMAPDWNKP